MHFEVFNAPEVVLTNLKSDVDLKYEISKVDSRNPMKWLINSVEADYCITTKVQSYIAFHIS